MLKAAIDWLDLFLFSPLRVCAVNLVVRGGYMYYNLERKTVSDPSLGYLTLPDKVAPFAIDWVGKKNLWSTLQTAPHFLYSAQQVKKDGMMYKDDLRTGNLIQICNPTTPEGWLFLNRGNPHAMIYGAGINYAIADNVELLEDFLNGEKIPEHAHLNYDRHNYERFYLD